MSELVMDSMETKKDTRIDDPEKAYVMAVASARNELNRVAFKTIALNRLQNPGFDDMSRFARLNTRKESDIKDVKIDDRFNNTAKGTEPETRVVTTTDSMHDATDTTLTMDSAIKEARREREEADRVAQIAADHYDTIKNL